VKSNVIVINERDNVAIALRDIKSGERVILPGGETLVAAGDIPYSHKVALREVAPGEEIIKYGEVIGHAMERVVLGAWVHSHNLMIKEGGE
jgi:altronate dehydratase